MRVLLAAVALVVALAPAAQAKKFRYASGPVPPADTALAEAEATLEPIVRERGPRVAVTNLQMTSLVANRAIERALQAAPLDSGTHVVIAPAESHPLNFVAENAALRALARRGVSATVRRTVIPDDSLALAVSDPGDPVLEYTLATARVTYLRMIGGYLLPSRVKIERQAIVEGTLTLRDPATARVLWIADANGNLVDAFPRGQLKRVEDERYADLRSEVPERNLGRLTEPVVVVAVVAGLIVLFFQNRP
uniref:Uncharacterized protein n=1 Tax=Eiseniibacteriota bacterium TaxID=2212470 RepID=A0A832I3T4_UNCEI